MDELITEIMANPVGWVWQNLQNLAIVGGVLISIGVAVWRLFFRKPPDTSPPTRTRDLKRFYYASLDQDCETLKLNLIENKLGQNQQGLALSKIYQDQRIRVPKPAHQEQEARHDEPEPLLVALGKMESKRLVILGKVGAGKSSFANYLTHLIIQSHTTPVQGLPSFMNNRPVVRVLLRELGVQWCEEAAVAQASIWQAIKQAVRQQISKGLTAQAEPDLVDGEFEVFWAQWRQEIVAQAAVLLFDGLDEMSNPTALVAFQRALLAFAHDAQHQPLMIIVTSRPAAYERPDQQLTGFVQTQLEPMNDEQIQAFIEQWYQVIGSRGATPATTRAANLLGDISENSALREMAERPLLLTLLIGLDAGGKSVRGSRPKVYSEIIDLLLDRWNKNLEDYAAALSEAEQEGLALLKRDVGALEKALQHTAYSTYKLLAQQQEAGLVFPVVQVLGCLSQAMGQGADHEHVVAFLQQRSTLLMAGGDADTLQFAHKSFHEYLAARYLRNQEGWKATIKQHLVEQPQWWREVFLFMAKEYADGQYSDAVTFLRDDILGDYTPAGTDAVQQRLLLLAATAAVEMALQQEADKPSRQQLLIFLRTELTRVLSSAVLSIQERAEAGRLLSQLGDPRHGVTTHQTASGQIVPDIDWVDIPAGTFRMGSEDDDPEADDNEKPAHAVTVAAFKMSRYPVANAQYRCFVEAGGAEPWLWHYKRWSLDNHPVIGVSWHDAQAYCTWLNEVMAAELGEWRIRLPTEAEWEYACRGESGWRYAWGNDAPDPTLANYADTNLGQTSAVGLFPAGKAFGLYDLSGNVWEWVADVYEAGGYSAPARRSESAPEPRVLRGGSWYDGGRLCRSANRGGDAPDLRGNVVGIRLALGHRSGAADAA